MSLKLKNIDAFVFDFDGVLTNNLVYLDSNGNEWVSCSRADGLGFDAIKKLNKLVFILSTEQNQVVTARAKKLNVPVLQGVNNKGKCLKELASKEGIGLGKILYVGNDLNDYHAMKLCGFAVCPSDSHSKILAISDNVLQTTGGNGVVREILEDLLELDLIKILYNK